MHDDQPPPNPPVGALRLPHARELTLVIRNEEFSIGTIKAQHCRIELGDHVGKSAKPITRISLGAVGLLTVSLLSACSSDVREEAADGMPTSDSERVASEVSAPDLTVRLKVYFPVVDGDCSSAIDGSLVRLTDESGALLAEPLPIRAEGIGGKFGDDGTACSYAAVFSNVPDSFEYTASVEGFSGQFVATPTQLEEGSVHIFEEPWTFEDEINFVKGEAPIIERQIPVSERVEDALQNAE